MEDFFIFLLWLFFCIWVGRAATNKGYSGILYFLFAFILSPIIAGVTLALFPDKKQNRRIDEVDNKTDNLKKEMDFNQKYNELKQLNLENQVRMTNDLNNRQYFSNLNNQQYLQEKASQKSKQNVCPKCNFVIEESSKFCNNCGEKIEPDKIKCRKCSKENMEKAKFCQYCGNDLTSAEPKKDVK